MKEIKDRIVNFIKVYISASKSKGVVVGMSGGKDSFVTAKLCVEALGKDCVFGVIMPNSSMKDLEIAKAECEILNIKYSVLDINASVNQILNLTKKAANNLSEVSAINTPPRIRMTLLYSIAASLEFLVVNTSNLSEIMIGYSTKWGDGVGDFAPIAELTKTEVCKLGEFLNLPLDLVYKTPDDGLSGVSDEEKLGFTYKELDDFIRSGKIAENYEKILKMYKNSNHKRKIVQKCTFDFPNAFLDID